MIEDRFANSFSKLIKLDQLLNYNFFNEERFFTSFFNLIKLKKLLKLSSFKEE